MLHNGLMSHSNKNFPAIFEAGLQIIAESLPVHGCLRAAPLLVPVRDLQKFTVVGNLDDVVRERILVLRRRAVHVAVRVETPGQEQEQV